MVSHLTHIIVLRVQILAEGGQQVSPTLQAPFGSNSGDEYANGGSDQRRRIPNGSEAFWFDELCHLWGKLLEVDTYVVLEDEAAKRASWLIWRA